MKYNKNGGFTVVEVLMFLAISGAMFTIAFFGTRGTQDSVAFRESLNSIESKIRETINNVDNGYFGNSGEYVCDGTGVQSASSNEGGGNSGNCLFWGKEMLFQNTEYMQIDVLLKQRLGSQTEIAIDYNAFPVFRDKYNYEYSVIYANKDDAGNMKSIKVRATRNTDTETQNSEFFDTRSLRQVKIGADNWENIDSTNSPMLCFTLGDRLGGIQISQKDLTVKYVIDDPGSCS
jgi:hypothetical protein